MTMMVLKNLPGFRGGSFGYLCKYICVIVEKVPKQNSDEAFVVQNFASNRHLWRIKRCTAPGIRISVTIVRRLLIGCTEQFQALEAAV